MLAVLVCLLGWVPFMGRPLSPDEGGLLMVARQWGPGDSLYGDYWVDRPPLLIVLVAIGNLLGGAWGLRVLGLVAVFASVVLAGRLGRVVAPHTPTAGLLPALTAGLLIGTPLFGGSVVNAELLGLPFLLTGMVAAVTCTRTTGRAALWWGTAAGAAGAAAFLVKQNLLDVFVLLLMLAVMTTLRGSGRAAAAMIVAAAKGAVVVLVVVLGGAALLGTGFGDLWTAVVSFRWEAASVVLDSPAAGHRFRLLLLALLGSGAPLLVGELLLRLRRPRRDAGGAVPGLLFPALAVIVWEVAAVLGGGSFWVHYLMGLVPGLVLLSALVGLPERVRSSVGVTYALVAVSTLCSIGWIVVHPIDRSEHEVAMFLAARAEPGDTATVTFGVPSILEAADLESPYQHLWSLPVRVRDQQLHELAGLLAGSDRPTWLVISGIGLGSWGIDTDAAQPYIALHYDRVADVAGYRIFREKEGAPG